MAQASRKDSSINLRALPDQKKLIDMAAALSHKSRSDFMLEASCREAENLGLKSLLKSVSPWEKEAHLNRFN